MAVQAEGGNSRSGKYVYIIILLLSNGHRFKADVDDPQPERINLLLVY